MWKIIQAGLLGAVTLTLVLSPSGAMGQTASPVPGCAGSVEPVAQGLTQTARDLNAIVADVSAIDAKLAAYYQTVAVPAGQAQPNHDQVQAATASAKKKAETEIAQLPSLQLRCAPDLAASIARLDKEVGEAAAATRDYRAAVRGQVLVLRTAALRTATPGPDADRGVEGL